MYDGWFSLGGQEIANNERYAAYAAILGLPTPRDEVRCTDLAAVLADSSYTTGGLAGAPWADASVPEASGFSGLFIQSVTGWDASTSVTTLVDLAGNGAVPGQARNGTRTMLVTAFLAATSDLSLRYGLAWLDAVLHDDCSDPCSGVTLCALAACPDCDTGTTEEADECWVELARTIHDVVTVDGPRVVQYHDLSGSCTAGAAGATVEFTLVAASPFIYRFPATVAADLTFTAPEESEDCAVEWIPVGPGRETCPSVAECSTAGDCVTDPLAPPILELGASTLSGWCASRPTSAWTAATAPAGLLPRWLDSVPLVTVTPGAVDMRRLSVRFYANPTLTEVTDPALLDECSTLAEINVAYLARDTTLVIDGRTQEAYVLCPGGARENADPVLTGPGGAAFEWPRLVCGAQLSVVALVDAEFYDPAAAVSVELAARTDVA